MTDNRSSQRNVRLITSLRGDIEETLSHDPMWYFVRSLSLVPCFVRVNSLRVTFLDLLAVQLRDDAVFRLRRLSRLFLVCRREAGGTRLSYSNV